MKTIFEKIDYFCINKDTVEKAAGILKLGGLVAFPTETVYGLGANGLDAYACKKIYEAKGRPSDNPLILHIADFSYLPKIVKEIPESAKKIMDKFWPGPITIIFPKADCVPYEITGGLETVAVRFPSNELARMIIREADLPIAAPSANSSGKPSPTKAEHVKHDLDGKIDMIVDGGATDVGLESTIIDVTSIVPTVLRPGAITIEMLNELLGEVEVDPAVYKKADGNTVPKAPGMKYKHYSPKADILLLKGDFNSVAKKVNEYCEKDFKDLIKSGIIATKQTEKLYKKEFAKVIVIGDRDKPETIGANLFDVLREFDNLDIEKVYSEMFDTSGEGAAIMNRLNKAAGYNCIEV